MSITAIGSYQYEHYQRLSEECQLMSCEWAGANIDYFTLVVRAAGLTAVSYEREINTDPEYVDMIGNGTVDVGWGFRRIDPGLFKKISYALPITGMTYGYVAMEDRTEVRNNFIFVFFDINTIIFVICTIFVNIINIIFEMTEILKARVPKTKRKSLRHLFNEVYSEYVTTAPQRMALPSRILLSFYFLATIIFATVFQSLITSILVSDQVKGYEVDSFSKLLDKLEFYDYNALIWPSFRLQVYCKDDECERWNRLKSLRTIAEKEKNYAYFNRIARESKIVGFTSIGDELLRSEVIVFNRRARLLFITDQIIPQQHFSFMIAKKRLLVEKFNRAIAMTSSVYPRTMARYMAPYGIYSKQIPNIEVSPMKLSNFESVWPFFGVCVGIIIAVFFIEIVVFYLLKHVRI